MDCQFMSIYCKFVTSQTTSFSHAVHFSCLFKEQGLLSFYFFEQISRDNLLHLYYGKLMSWLKLSSRKFRFTLALDTVDGCLYHLGFVAFRISKPQNSWDQACSQSRDQTCPQSRDQRFSACHYELFHSPQKYIQVLRKM